MEAFAPAAPADRTVVELRPRLRKQKLDREFRWEPGKGEIEKVIADIWPKKKSDRLRGVDGLAPRRPPLTHEARRATDEISELLWKAGLALDRLKEPGLKGIAFEFRRRSKTNPESGRLYQAIAEMADDSLEIMRRRRSEKGVWFALVEVIQWDDGVGESLERYWEQCSGSHPRH